MLVKRLFVVVFLTMISLPVLLIPVNDKINTYGNENRLRATLPKFSMESPLKFIQETDDYFKDNFAFRSHLSNLFFYIKSKLFEVDPLPSKVLKGKDDWLFLGNSFNNVFNESLGLINHSPAARDSICQEIISMKSFCDSLGIKFYFAVAPNKHTFYKEYLPASPLNRPRRYDLLKKQLKEEWNFEVIDLQEYMLPVKDNVRLFHKTDSHWNEYGAFLGTQKLIDVIKKDFPLQNISLEKFKIDTVFSHQMDLTQMLNLQVPEQHYRFEPKEPFNEFRVDLIEVPNKRIDFLIKTSNNKAPFKAIIFRDSFFSAMSDFFSPCIGRCNLIWSYTFDKEMILEEKPDFVVFEVVERNLDQLVPQKLK